MPSFPISLLTNSNDYSEQFNDIACCDSIYLLFLFSDWVLGNLTYSSAALRPTWKPNKDFIALMPQILRGTSSSGIRRIITPTGILNAPSTIETAHWFPSSLVMANALPPMKMIKIWPPTIIILIAIKNQLRQIPSKILNLLLSCRLLSRVSRLVLICSKL